MQAIHHTHQKQAQKAGITLEPEHNQIKAFWPSRNLAIFGQDAKFALMQMLAAKRIIEKYEGDGHQIRIEHDPRQPMFVRIQLNDQWLEGANPPILWETTNLTTAALEDKEMTQEEAETHQRVEAMFQEDSLPPTINGIPTDGRVAHKKGFAIIDAPFIDDDDGPQTQARWKWEEEWEASAADSLDSIAEPELEKTGSVVKVKYRALYAEQGHPMHCGDELANYLNSLVKVGSHTDMDIFDAIMKANDIDMSKYNRTNIGWQGRYRMTGRNILAKRVHANGGLLHLPETINGGEPKQMSQEWIGSQRFK